ncbi:OmpA family protein [Geobacter sulfurreducens]|uniref:OmpA family protein n=1 Tax=Geobacter sulfurreducens TaxID=35554 RepID=UPI002B59D184|nr:OmpA family protein [Geobacter sulfurreducens]HML79246.1 OmpA family protein [Geobacter sulfurreducens]
MKVRTIVGVAFAVALLVASTAAAENRAGFFSLSPYFGGYTFDGEQHIRTAPTFGIRGGYNLTPTWGVETVFGFSPAEETKGSQVDVDSYTYRLEGLYHFMPESSLVPFLAVGAGGTTLDYAAGSNGRDRTDGILTYGGGVKYFITDVVAVRGDVRGIFDLGYSYSNVEYTVGLSYLFGGAAPAARAVPAPQAAPAPPAPEPAPAVEPESAPLPMAAEPTPGLMKYCITLNMEFDIDKANVRPQYHDEVKRVADFLKEYPSTTAVIEGHTDNVGDDAYNMRLSQRRAESVVNYLVDNFGIDRARLSARGFGKTRPIADNSTEAGKQRNRRIEAIIDCALEDPKVIAALPDRLCIALKVQFDTDKWDIKPQYRGEIAKVGDFMTRNPTTTAIIEGHTDRVGTADHNMKLSLRRAEAVVNYLVEHFGIERSRLSAKGYGFSRPIAYNSTAEGRALNRRINAIIDCVIKK